MNNSLYRTHTHESVLGRPPMKGFAGYCSECNQECSGHTVDFGYGLTEMGGVVDNDINNQYVSTCCDMDILEEEPEGE